MARPNFTPRPYETPDVGQDVEVLSSFDHHWYNGFRVLGVDRTTDHVAVVLARSDGSVLPRPVDSFRVRPSD